MRSVLLTLETGSRAVALLLGGTSWSALAVMPSWPPIGSRSLTWPTGRPARVRRPRSSSLYGEA